MGTKNNRAQFVRRHGESNRHDLGIVLRVPRTYDPRRVMTLDEMANVAAFVASYKASGTTGTIVSLTMGSLFVD